MAVNFEERHKELCQLASFVSEQEQWLDSILHQLKWNKSSLQIEIVQCSINDHHYVPVTFLETHKRNCYYATKGVGGASIDHTSPMIVRKDTLYNDVHVPSVEIDERIEKAVKVVASDPGLYQSQESRDCHVKLNADSVEDTVNSGLDSASLTPQQLISYIKSWKKVPLDWRSVVPSSLNLSQLKGWLFHHLPTEHAHSSSVGGEIVAVDSIIQCLIQVSQTVTPNALMESLKPLLRTNTGPFVLSLWKHLHISCVMAERGVTESVIEDIAPMHLTQLLSLQHRPVKSEQDDIPQAYTKISEIVGEVGPASDVTPPLPSDAVFYSSSPAERRVRYDYIVGASRVKAPKKKKTIDPDLYRNDEAALKAKLKAEAQAGGGGMAASEDTLRERKEKRDYKRRRQKYRAKNVHVTRRKTSEIFRDIINNRMEEIIEALPPPIKRERVTEDSTQAQKRPSSSRPEDSTDQEREHRGSSRKKKKRSARSRSHSKSRERRHSHKKHKKHKSHKHSSSREH